MKLVSFSESGGRERPGILLDEGSLVIDLANAGFIDTLAVIAWICLVVLSGYILGARAQKNLHYIVLGIALVSMLPVIIGVTKEILASRKMAA